MKATIHAFTVCHFGSEAFLPQCPFILILVEFEGANTLFLSRLVGMDPNQASLDWIGMKVKARYLRNSKFQPTDVYFCSRRDAIECSVRPYRPPIRDMRSAMNEVKLMPDTTELLQQGIALVKAGRREEARAILLQVIEQDEQTSLPGCGFRASWIPTTTRPSHWRTC